MIQKRGAIFVGITFALMVPYLGFGVYEVLRFPPGQVPRWIINTILVWLIANFIILTLVVARLRRK